MGYKTPPKGKGFQPGKSGNPQGARLHNVALKKLKRLAAPELARIIDLMLQSSVAELRTLKKNKKLPALDAWIVAIILKAQKRGDGKALEVILSRALGKPPTTIKASPAKPESTSGTAPVLHSMSSQDRMAYYRMMIEKLNRALEDEANLVGGANAFESST